MKQLAVLSLVVVLLTGAASAATMTLSDSVPLMQTDINTTMSVLQFDSNLGTLTQVKVIVGGQLAGGYGYESMAAYAGGSFRYIISQVLDIKLGSDTLLTDSSSIDAYGSIPVIAGFDGSIDFAGTSGGKVTTIDQSKTEMYTFISAGDMAQFIGLGVVNVDFAFLVDGTSTVYQPNPQGPICISFSQGGGSLEVEYTYTPVPEPATLAILGLGGLLLRRRIA